MKDGLAQRDEKSKSSIHEREGYVNLLKWCMLLKNSKLIVFICLTPGDSARQNLEYKTEGKGWTWKQEEGGSLSPVKSMSEVGKERTKISSLKW